MIFDRYRCGARRESITNGGGRSVEAVVSLAIYQSHASAVVGCASGTHHAFDGQQHLPDGLLHGFFKQKWYGCFLFSRKKEDQLFFAFF